MIISKRAHAIYTCNLCVNRSIDGTNCADQCIPVQSEVYHRQGHEGRVHPNHGDM